MGRIIWLASFPKSGNTWMRAFLHNLLRDPRGGYDINRLGEFSFSDSTIRWYQTYLTKPAKDWSTKDVMETRWKVQRDLGQQSTDDVFVKTHNAHVEFDGMPMIHMDLTAGAIYIVRNPLDICISLADHYACSIDQAIDIMANNSMGTPTGDQLVFEMHKSWSVHVLSWTNQPGPWLHIVRYEDMLKKPMVSFSRVAKFLGLHPPRERIERAVAASSFESLRAQEEEKGFRERSYKADKFFRVGKAGQWRDALSKAQIGRVVEGHKEQMERFGYWPL
ncbi:MAG TPA: sulfotransferase domain-containing protein [Candidatus Cybelea sp.]|nr:sulfotransferase domain-containing protein [Candidatus Cybelea sp.]